MLRRLSWKTAIGNEGPRSLQCQGRFTSMGCLSSERKNKKTNKSDWIGGENASAFFLGDNEPQPCLLNLPFGFKLQLRTMAHKETLEYHLGTQIDAEEGQDRVDSWKDAASLSLQVPESWQHETKGSTAEEPPLKEPPQKK